MGPLSFSIYTIPIGRLIQRHGVDYHLYADDIQLYSSFDPTDCTSINLALSALALCISEIQSWMSDNMLKLNNEKTEFFVATSPHHKHCLPPVSLQIGAISIKPSETVRNLGIIFDNQMSMNNQVSSLSRSVSFHLRNISRIRRFLDFNTCNHVVRSLILSRLDYGNVLLLGTNKSEIARLQQLQNWAARLIFCSSKYEHTSPLLQQLHWLPINERIHFKAMLYIYKCLNGLAPSYLTPLCPLYQARREGLRSVSDTTHLNEVLFDKRCLISAANKTFSYSAPKFWNQLPANIRTSSSLTVFKKSLKTHLFSIY